MLRRTLLFALLLSCVPLAEAQRGLDNAIRAQQMLGPELWSQIITIRNETRGGTYPPLVHALIFELAGVLWFYTDADGTQSFSLHLGRLENEKANIAPLLRDIDPGFRSWSVVQPGKRGAARGSERLPNGCFIESMAALRSRVLAGQKLESPRLLSYYADTPTGRRGHTVLTYQAAGGVEVVDTAAMTAPRVLDRRLANDPLRLARALEGDEVVKARFVELRGFTGTIDNVALTESESPANVVGLPSAGKPAS